MNEELIREAIEQADPKGEISSDVVEEIVLSLSEKEIEDVPLVVRETIEENLKEQLIAEPSWKKRASIAARIISLGLE